MGTLFSSDESLVFLSSSERDSWIARCQQFMVIDVVHKEEPLDAFGKGKWIFSIVMLDESATTVLYSMQDGNPVRDRKFAKLADYLRNEEMYGPCVLAYGEQFQKGFKKPIVIKDYNE